MLQKLVFFCFVVSLVKTTPLPFSKEDFFDSASDDGQLRVPGTDLGLYNHGFFEGDIYRREYRMRNAVADSGLTWDSGVIVYKTDDNLGCPDSQQCAILMKAINHYHKHSCIRFKEWTGEKDYIRIFVNPDTGACWSTVGRQGGEQLVSLGQRCWYIGIVIHELGHSLGFWHEMNRPDRDEFIDINWPNILPGFAGAFAKYTEDTVNTLNERFDFKSIMMYDEFAFAKNKRSPTIATKDNSIIGPLWLKKGLSDSDTRRLNKLYECNDVSPKAEFPYDVTCTFDNHTCGFKNAGSAQWKWEKKEVGGYIYTVGNSTTEVSPEATTGYFMSVNFHGKTQTDEDGSSMGCVRFWYMIRGSEQSYLKLRQSYLSSSTQLAFIQEDTFDLWESEGTSATWRLLHVPLYVTSPFRLIFESSVMDSAENLIAIDDFTLEYTPCPVSNEDTTAQIDITTE